MTWMRDSEYDVDPEWASEQAIMQVPHPWHFFVSTTRYPSLFGMTTRPSASRTAGPATTAHPVAAEVARNRRRVVPSERVGCSDIVSLRPGRDFSGLVFLRYHAVR
jgi:hypothetical protein